MSLKQVVKRLKGDSLWDRIYNKHKKRRNRDEDKISLEKCRKEALVEFYNLREQIKLVKPNLNPSDYNNYINKELSIIQQRQKETKETDYYIIVAGKSMLNSRWQRLKRIQKEKGTSKTSTPDEELKRYLLSQFKNDEGKPHKNKAVDLG